MRRPVFKFVTYDAAKYCFAKLFADRVFGVDDLSRLHEKCLAEKYKKGEKPVITHEDNLAARQLLKNIANSSWFPPVYRAFAVNIVAPLFGNKITYNWPPVFRVHMAGSPSVSAWHRDVEVTGRHDLITVWVPFVDTFDTNCIWAEATYGNQDERPIEVKHGQALLFDSGYLRHGSVANSTNVTRVSMDFRVAPKRRNLDQPDLGILSARPRGFVVDTSNAAIKHAPIEEGERTAG